jgi:transposase
LKCPQLNPYPQKRSVVILDNCSIHHDEELRRMIIDECGWLSALLWHWIINKSTGARLVYLPPYSPGFNPIEKAFSTIKAWLKQHEEEFTNAASLQ